MLPCDVDIPQDKILVKNGHYLVCCINMNRKQEYLFNLSLLNMR